MQKGNKIIFLGIVVLIIGGAVMFLLAYNFYPSKYFSLSFYGHCYEFFSNAYSKYLQLELQREKEILLLQTKSIGDPKFIIPITFSGTDRDIQSFVSKNNINITERIMLPGDNISKKVIIKGKITNWNLEKIIQNEFNVSDVNSFKKTIVHTLGIESNKFLSSKKSNQIANQINNFTINNIQKIIDEKEGVRSIECGNNIGYYIP